MIILDRMANELSVICQEFALLVMQLLFSIEMVFNDHIDSYSGLLKDIGVLVHSGAIIYVYYTRMLEDQKLEMKKVEAKNKSAERKYELKMLEFQAKHGLLGKNFKKKNNDSENGDSDSNWNTMIRV